MRLVNLLVLVYVTYCAARPEDIYLEDGGYKNILVAVHPAVKYDENIVSKLKNIFVQASESLYKATEYDLRISGKPDEEKTSAKHFKDIRLLLPKSWGKVPGCKNARTEIYDNADFRVEPESPQWGHLMKTTMMNSECREPGVYTVIPETYVSNELQTKDIYGDNLGMGILHEWGQLRYGLHDESNVKNGGDTCKVLYDYNTYRYREPIRCSKLINGLKMVDPEDGSKCIFKPEKDTPAVKAKASVMFFNLPFYKNVYTFCDGVYVIDGEYHNPLEEYLHDDTVDNPHNDICDRKSAWEVLREHPDFDPDNAGPWYPEFDFNWALNMTCVQQSDMLRIVLVLDISGSMNEESRLEQMIGDVALFLKSLPYGETEVGMIEFSTAANDLIDMTTLDSDETLRSLLLAIPRTAAGWTCIGCGIQNALAMLERGSAGSAAGGMIVVFTDGEETLDQNLHPTIKEITPTVIEKEAIIHGLLMAGVTDDHDLIKLAIETGGDFCIFEDSGTGGTDSYLCMNNIIDSLGNYAAVQIKTEDYTLTRGQSAEEDILIDDSFTDNLRFTLSWKPPTNLKKFDEASEEHVKEARSTACDNMVVTLTAPDGTTITQGDARYEKDAEFYQTTIDAAGFAAGTWKYTITNNNIMNNPCINRIRIEGLREPTNDAVPDEELPVLMSVSTSKAIVALNQANTPAENVVTIYATIKQGLSPIIGTKVQAVVERFNGAKVTIELLDNGTGADMEGNDGVYSRYFHQYDGNGAYSVKVTATGADGEVKILREIRELAQDEESESWEVQRIVERVPYSAFERATVGSFDVSGYTPAVSSWFPPSKISDVRMEGYDIGELTVTWTAVGASMDEGQASSYHMRLCKSSVDLREYFTSCTEINDSHLLHDTTLLAPQTSGTVEHIVLDHKALQQMGLDGIYFIGLRAVNGLGNEGPISNMVSFQIGEPEYQDSNVLAIVFGALGAVCLVGLAFGGVFYYKNAKESRKVDDAESNRHDTKA